MDLEDIDIELLRLCRNKKEFDKYNDIVKQYMLTKESWGLLGDFNAYYEANPSVEDINEEDFKLWFRITRHPQWKSDKHVMYGSIVSSIFSRDAKESTVRQLTGEVIRKEIASSIGAGADLESIQSLLQDLERAQSDTITNSKIVSESVEDIISNAIRVGGYTWRLEDLNIAVGPVSQGDLIIVAKRPETGGTSFVLSEITHMVKQLPENKHVLFINNEEFKTKIISRAVSCALDIDTPTLYSDPKRYGNDYKTYLGDKRIDLMSDGSIHIFEIEKQLKSGEYGLIVINTLEKLKGYNKMEDYQRLEKLGQWARNLALQYGPVFIIVQSDASAEGTQYPDQSMLYKTKTGLQGEADLLIFLGKSNDETIPEETRFIHVAKNKLPGTSKTVPALRHIKSEVLFDINTGRWKSKSWK